MIYCEPQDLYKAFSALDTYDLKQSLLENNFVVASGIIWDLNDSGSIAVLYRDGEDLGAAQATVGAVLTDSQWFYDTSADKLTLATTNAPTTYRIEASPQTWEDAKTEVIKRASEMLESLLDTRFERPLPRATHSDADRDYDYYITKSTAILAVMELVAASDPNDPVILVFRNMLWNEEQTGIIDLINSGSIKFSFEITDSDKEGQFEEVTVNPATTGYPYSQQGIATVAYGVSLIEITAGGTMTTGTANTTVTYKVTNESGDEIVAATLATFLYQSFGYGITGLFKDGVYTTGDKWSLTVQGIATKNSFVSIKLIT